MARKFSYTKSVHNKKTDFPNTGNVTTIYINASDNKAYRWDDAYYEISSSELDLWGAIGDVSNKGGAAWGEITGTLSSQTDLNTALNSKVGSYASNHPINGYISANGQLNVGIEQANAFSDGYLSSTDYQYFATKQDGLVSGVNIKTVNSNSLLGSGDVAVQPTLVSGTNIKTINGSSVLGSGNLTISSGGGAGIHALIPPATGQLINMSISSEQTSINGYGSANNIIMIPFIPANTFTINQFSFNVTTAAAGSNATISIWSNSAMKPTNRLYLSPLIPTATTGIKNQAATFTFTAGTVYWIGFNQSSPCQYRVYKASDILTFSGNAFSGVMQNGWFFSGYVPGTEPNPLPGSNASQLSFFPMLLMRVN